jgi:hypothetical protein
MISASIPNPVPESGHFKRALPGHFWQAPKGEGKNWRAEKRIY